MNFYRHRAAFDMQGNQLFEPSKSIVPLNNPNPSISFAVAESDIPGAIQIPQPQERLMIESSWNKIFSDANCPNLNLNLGLDNDFCDRNNNNNNNNNNNKNPTNLSFNQSTPVPTTAPAARTINTSFDNRQGTAPNSDLASGFNFLDLVSILANYFKISQCPTTSLLLGHYISQQRQARAGQFSEGLKSSINRNESGKNIINDKASLFTAIESSTITSSSSSSSNENGENINFDPASLLYLNSGNDSIGAGLCNATLEGYFSNLQPSSDSIEFAEISAQQRVAISCSPEISYSESSASTANSFTQDFFSDCSPRKSIEEGPFQRFVGSKKRKPRKSKAILCKQRLRFSCHLFDPN